MPAIGRDESRRDRTRMPDPLDRTENDDGLLSNEVQTRAEA